MIVYFILHLLPLFLFWPAIGLPLPLPPLPPLPLPAGACSSLAGANPPRDACMPLVLPDRSLSPMPPPLLLKSWGPPLKPAILAPMELRLPLNFLASLASSALSFSLNCPYFAGPSPLLAPPFFCLASLSWPNMELAWAFSSFSCSFFLSLRSFSFYFLLICWSDSSNFEPTFFKSFLDSF